MRDNIIFMDLRAPRCQALIERDEFIEHRPINTLVLPPPPACVYAKHSDRWWCTTPEEMAADERWIETAQPLSSYGEKACEHVNRCLIKRDTHLPEVS